MLGSSRDSRSALRRDVEARASEANATVAEQLLAVAALLGAEKSLRSTLADAGQPAEVRSALVNDLFGGKVQALAAALLSSAVALRWSDGDDLVDAIEELGAAVAFTAAEADGSLDRVEEELFRFGRAVEANADLQMTLTNPALDGAAKVALVRDLVASQASPVTTVLLAHTAANLRGRRVDAAVNALCNLAAAQRERVVAQVRVAVELDAAQHERLAAALARLIGRAVRCNITVDPAVIGGVSVRIGDDVIDGTFVTRLTQARRTLAGEFVTESRTS